MKTKNQLESEYNNFINIEYKKLDILRNADQAGYKWFGNAWATVVSIDIVDFKAMQQKIDNENVVKIIQMFTDTVISSARDDMFKDIFRDAYLAGDQVLVVLDATTKEKISKAIDFSFYINSQINNVLSEFLIKNISALSKFKAGIGIWTSNDNTLVYNGQKHTQNYNFSTLIGSAINYSSALSNIANRGTYPPILMNWVAYNNAIGSTKESIEKWTNKVVVSQVDQTIYGGNIVKTMYEE